MENRIKKRPHWCGHCWSVWDAVTHYNKEFYLKCKSIDYIFGIGYKVQNLASNKISKFITGEVKSPNCKKFERIITIK